MTESTVLDMGHKALTLTIMICAPMLGLGLIVGLVISVFQAATQIHEVTLTFVPKIVAVAAALVLFGPWMLRQMVGYTAQLLQQIPTLVK